MVAMSKSSMEAMQDLNAEIHVRGRHPKAYAKDRGFWYVFSDPDLPESESYLGSAICKKDAWRNAWHNVKGRPSTTA